MPHTSLNSQLSHMEVATRTTAEKYIKSRCNAPHTRKSLVKGERFMRYVRRARVNLLYARLDLFQPSKNVTGCKPTHETCSTNYTGRYCFETDVSSNGDMNNLNCVMCSSQSGQFQGRSAVPSLVGQRC